MRPYKCSVSSPFFNSAVLFLSSFPPFSHFRISVKQDNEPRHNSSPAPPPGGRGDHSRTRQQAGHPEAKRKHTRPSNDTQQHAPHPQKKEKKRNDAGRHRRPTTHNKKSKTLPSSDSNGMTSTAAPVTRRNTRSRTSTVYDATTGNRGSPPSRTPSRKNTSSPHPANSSPPSSRRSSRTPLCLAIRTPPDRTPLSEVALRLAPRSVRTRHTTPSASQDERSGAKDWDRWGR